MIEKILSELQVLKEDAVDKWDGGASHRAYTKAIEIVQEVAKEYGNGWIPVEERLPEDWAIVYATCVSLIDDRKPWVIEGIYFSGCGGFERMTPMLEYGDAKVIAWMPKRLPAPYQKGE